MEYTEEIKETLIKINDFIQANNNINYKIRLLEREVPNLQELVKKLTIPVVSCTQYGFNELKLNKMEIITIYKFQLEAIKEALRVTANIHDSRNKRKEGETCHDRMVRQAEKYAENALKGEKDIEVRYI
jgi:hypothetical protein